MRFYIIIFIFLSLEYAYNNASSTHQNIDGNSDCLTDEFYGDFTDEEIKHLINRRKKVREFMNKTLHREELRTLTLYVPVVFHNLYKTVDGSAINSYCDFGYDVLINDQDICNDRMLRSLEVLNAQYLPSGVQFELHDDYPEMLHATDPGFDGFFEDATGGTATSPEANALKEHYNIPNALNIYTHECLPSTVSSCNSGKLGFATYPWHLDNNEPGIFIKNQSLPGSGDTYIGATASQVGILAHEISHFFTLQHINGTWFLMDTNTPRELVSGQDCEFHGDFICDTPGSPGFIVVNNDLASYYTNSTSRECIYHGYGGDYDSESSILRIGGYNSISDTIFANYNYCEKWGFEDYYGLDNCYSYTNYDNVGDFFGTRGIPENCLNENKSEYATNCNINQYSYLPIGNNFMQAGTGTLSYCSPRPIGHADYDESNHGFTTEQFENIRTSLELDYTACNIEPACNTSFSIRKGIEPDMLIRSGESSCLYPCNKTESVEYYKQFRAGCLITDAEYQPDYSQYDCSEKLLSMYENINPQNFEINQIYPNPFNPITSISYSLPQNADLEISVIDINGRMIEILVNGFQFTGNYTISWDAASNPSGIYFIRLKTPSNSDTRKIVLIK